MGLRGFVSAGVVSAGVVLSPGGSAASVSTSCVEVTQYTAPSCATRNRLETRRKTVSVAGKSGFRFGIQIAVISAQAMKSPATISSVTLPVVVIVSSTAGTLPRHRSGVRENDRAEPV